MTDNRQAFFEQQLAENTLRTIQYEQMADTARKRGTMYKAKEWDDRVKKLKKEKEELIRKIDREFPVNGRHGGTV